MALCVSLNAEEPILVDTLEDFSQVLAYSPNLRIVDKTTPWLEEPDNRATRKDSKEAYLIYLVSKGMADFQIEVYTFGGVGKNLDTKRLQVLTSNDGKNFDPIDYVFGEPRQPTFGLSWYAVTITPDGEIPVDARFLKILLPEQEKDGWWPIVTKIEIFRRHNFIERNILGKGKR